MSIDINKIKFYAPVDSDYPDDGWYGGEADTTATQTSGVINNEFGDVTNEERISGLIDYRKQFIVNENVDEWEDVVVWISENTICPDDAIDICQAGSLSRIGDVEYLGVASYLESATILVFESDVNWDIRPGEWVYSYTFDANMERPREVVSVSQETVVISSAFETPTNQEDVIFVCPATMFTYTRPESKDDALKVGTLTASTAAGVWKRRTINPNASGYSNNSFTIRWESR